MATQQPFGFYDQSSSWVKHKPKQLQPTNTKSHKALKQTKPVRDAYARLTLALACYKKLDNYDLCNHIGLHVQNIHAREQHTTQFQSTIDFIQTNGKEIGGRNMQNWEEDWFDYDHEYLQPFFELLIHARRTRQPPANPKPYINFIQPTALGRLLNWPEPFCLSKHEIIAWANNNYCSLDQFEEEFQ